MQEMYDKANPVALLRQRLIFKGTKLSLELFLVPTRLRGNAARSSMCSHGARGNQIKKIGAKVRVICSAYAEIKAKNRLIVRSSGRPKASWFLLMQQIRAALGHR